MFSFVENSLFRPYPAARPVHKESRLACKPAFSLVELMIVLAILALIAAMVVPNLQRNFQRNQIREATRQLQEQVGLWRMQASETGSPLLIQFGLDSPQVRCWSLPTLSAATDDESSSTGRSLSDTNDLLSLNQSESDSPWREELWQMDPEVRFAMTAQTLTDSASQSSSTPDDSTSTLLDSSLTASSADASLTVSQWTPPVVLGPLGFESEIVIWVSNGQYQCPLLLQRSSAWLQTGRIRPVTAVSDSADANQGTTDSRTLGRGQY